MRFRNITTVATALLLSITGAAAQEPNAWSASEIASSATTTHYITKTVQRVVQTVFTHNSTSSTMAPSSVFSTGLPSGSMHSGTGLTTLHTGSATPTASGAGGSSTHNAAAIAGVEYGVVAIVGLAGLLVL